MPMLLYDVHGHEFELAVIPDATGAERQDAQEGPPPMVVTFRAANQDDEWEETAPVFGTSAIETLAEWLDAVGRGEPELDEIELVELDLRFGVLRPEGDSLVVIRIAFHLADAPELAAMTAPTDEASRLDIRVSRQMLISAAAQLRADLREIQDELDEDPVGLEGLRPSTGGAAAEEVEPERATEETESNTGPEEEEEPSASLQTGSSRGIAGRHALSVGSSPEAEVEEDAEEVERHGGNARGAKSSNGPDAARAEQGGSARRRETAEGDWSPPA